MKQFLMNEESGQGMVEYGLILALVAVVAVGVLTAVGQKINYRFNDVDAALETTKGTS